MKATLTMVPPTLSGFLIPLSTFTPQMLVALGMYLSGKEPASLAGARGPSLH